MGARLQLWAMATVLGAASALAGCKVSASTQSVVLRAGPPQGPRRAQSPPPAAPLPAAAPAPETQQADPEAAKQFLESLSQPSAPLSVTMKPPEVTAMGLANTARGEASGMTPDQAITAAALQEGERAVVPVTLGPGECATFIAQGGLGIVEVDLFLTTGQGSQARILAQDPTSGPIAVLGGKGACFKNPQQGAAQVDLSVRARRGAGLVIVRGYRR